MLVIRAFINEYEIDEVLIQNTGDTDKWGRYIYRIKEPELDVDIKHYRHRGWKELAKKALDALVEENE